MALDDDAILLSFFERYNEEDEEEQLKFEVIKYVSGNFGSKPVVQDEQNTTGDTLDSMSSPVDSAVDMKKKKRLAALNQKKKAEEIKPVGGFGVVDCDLGASPQILKGSVFSKKNGGGGGTFSPIAHADKFKLGKRH
jgi:hypothetical protein